MTTGRFHLVWRVGVLLLLSSLAVTHVIEIRQTSRLLEAMNGVTGGQNFSIRLPGGPGAIVENVEDVKDCLAAIKDSVAEMKDDLADAKNHLAEIEAATIDPPWRR
ncbi:MAG: hypothetical protein AAB654_08945 [Acidobacteriota bacterium]